jgi:general secretion pathway protein M
MINRLSDREKIFLGGGILSLLVVLVWAGIYTPYRRGVTQAETQIASRQRQLEDVRHLEREYHRLQQELAAAERQMSGGAQGSSLFSFIEDVTTRSGVRENLVSMRPQTAQMQGDYREESVEVRLERVQLAQLVRLLHLIESADSFLKVKNLRAKPRFDNRAQLDTILLVSSFQKTT